MHRSAARVLSPLILSTLALPACTPKPSFQFQGKLSEMKPAPGVLGEDWTGPTGIVLDDLNRLDGLPEVQRGGAQELAEQLLPQGISACADFTFRRADTSFEAVTLRAFVFASETRLDDWWEVKYAIPAASGRYEKIENEGDRAFESTELKKRIVSLGNVLLTCHQLHEGEEYVRLLEHFLAELQASSPKG